MTLYEPTIIDPLPAGNGARTQEQWIALFNEQRKRMISAADAYRAGESASNELLKSLRNQFNLSWLVSSTRNGYSGDDLSGRITQNYGSEVVAPSQKDVLVIPVYYNTPLAQALQNEEGVSYLQALLGTSDGPKEIADTLERLSGRSASNTILWTPGQSSRKAYPERAVAFYDVGGRFHVLGNLLFDDYGGPSRGVSVSPRSGRAKK